TRGKPSSGEPVTAQTVAEQSAERGRNRRAHERQKQCGLGRSQRLGIFQQGAVPFRGEALPARAEPRSIERVDDDDRTWRVQKEIEHGGGKPKRQRRTFFHASPFRSL